jgi:RNA polymerase sigma factor (sigma-70 family)
MPDLEGEMLAQRCTQAVAVLRARYDWRLLDDEEFVRQTIEHLQSGVASDPYRAATHAYCLALYRACSGYEGDARQELGYTELFRYLYNIAYHRYYDHCDDVTQQAIERIFSSFERCRQPGAFLAFALQHLRDAVRTLRRQQQSHAPQSLDEMIGEERNAQEVVLPDPRIGLLEQVIAQEQWSAVKQIVENFLRDHPRSRKQLTALLLKYVVGMDDQAISQAMGMPIQSVYVLRSRAIKKLKQETSWRMLASELGIRTDET